MAAYEPGVALAWLFAALKDSSLLATEVTGVFRGIAAENQPTPYVVVSHHGGSDTSAATARVLTEVDYLVKTVGTLGSDDDATGVALDAIDTLLQDAAAVSSGVRINVRSIQSVEYSEPGAAGRNYDHRGRIWRFYLASN